MNNEGSALLPPRVECYGQYYSPGIRRAIRILQPYYLAERLERKEKRMGFVEHHLVCRNQTRVLEIAIFDLLREGESGDELGFE